MHGSRGTLLLGCSVVEAAADGEGVGRIGDRGAEAGRVAVGCGRGRPARRHATGSVLHLHNSSHFIICVAGMHM